jgi:hypothetical protein
MAKLQFGESKDVQEIKSGRVRDDSYDEYVRTAYENKGKVFEFKNVANEDVEDVRKGLQRSANFLRVRIAGPEYTDHGNGKTTIHFSAHDKMPRNGSRKVETATADAADVETADA